jgi:Domain of unknown function (DUF5666)
MKSYVKEPILFFTLLLTMLASCGPSPQAGGGIGGTGYTALVVSGPITNASSNNIAVSGYDYNTSSTVITMEGAPRNQSDLKKGMVVFVKATLAHHYGTNDPPQRTAQILSYEDTVEGIVQSVALDGSSLVALGQTVTITTKTILDASIPGQNILSLMPGRDLVEVSGFIAGDGTIIATLIILKTEAPDYQVKGFIKNHDAARKTLEIGSLTVDYRNADLRDMLNQTNSSWNGLVVNIRGSQVLSGGLGSHGVRMTATKVISDELGTADDDEDAEIQGFVTQVVAPGDFYLGNVHVRASAGTTVEGGVLNDILVGAHLEVHGSLVDGIVNAAKVEFE